MRSVVIAMANWVQLPLTSGRTVHVNLDMARTIEAWRGRTPDGAKCVIWFGGALQSELHVNMPLDAVLAFAKRQP